MAFNTSLYVRIGEAKELPGKDLISGSSDPYCLIKLDNEVVARTATVWRTLDPFWGEEYQFHLPGGFHNLSIYIYDEDTMSEDDLIGKVSIDKEMLQGDPRGFEKWMKLVKVDRDTEVQGEVHLEATLVEESGRKRVRLKVVEARDLAVKDKTGSSDPFVRLSFGGKNYETKTIKKTRYPRWEETFDLEVTSYLGEDFLELTMWDWDRMSNDDFMGRATLSLAELLPGQTVSDWVRLKPLLADGIDEDSPDLGSLRVKARYSEQRILPSQYYQPLVNLMVDSVQGKQFVGPTPLSILEEVMVLDRQEIAITLVKIFLGQGMMLPFLDAVIQQELKYTSDVNTLFRGNSLATKSFDQFMKVVGMPYLHETLKPVVDQIYEEKKMVELDPQKMDRLKRKVSVKKQSDSQLLESSTATITNYLASIVNCILMSVDRCPPVMRMAFRQLRQRVQERIDERFPNNSNEEWQYLCMSGFFFLRFFAPAVLSPKLFFLRDQHPNKHTGRTLTLLAKALQTIGNMGLQTGKEPWMEALNPLIMDSVTRIKDFLDRLLDINDDEVPSQEAQKRSVFQQNLTIKEGFLKKKRGENISVVTPFTFKRRYFWLSYDNISFAKLPEDEVRNTIQTNSICVVEVVDEGAFHLDNMIQITYRDSNDVLNTLYIQAQDVNDRHQWLSSIRKTCVSNPDMLRTFHPGAFRTGRWTCCLGTARAVDVGCSKAHCAATLGDWRDPLDPDVEAQVIYSQLLLGKDTLKEKYSTESTTAGTEAVTKRAKEAAGENSTGKNSDEKEGDAPKTNGTTHSDAEVRPHQTCKKTMSYHDSRMAATGLLLDVIGDIEKAHAAFEKRAKEKDKVPRLRQIQL
ncbi:rasGAP-activating-like protein 1 isoform X2 [Amphiura filiformis]|uniref:rasGAP-activating-like protein 1 isoform X2 n=1 Tax=Amphiura filiformis TaxID=82378 RepID=UPI003B21FD8C